MQSRVQSKSGATLLKLQGAGSRRAIKYVDYTQFQGFDLGLSGSVKSSAIVAQHDAASEIN